MMVHTCNYITQKAEARGLLHTGSQAKLQNETISKKKIIANGLQPVSQCHFKHLTWPALPCSFLVLLELLHPEDGNGPQILVIAGI